MNEWMNESMKGIGEKGWMNEWNDERKDEWMNDRIFRMTYGGITGMSLYLMRCMIITWNNSGRRRVRSLSSKFFVVVCPCPWPCPPPPMTREGDRAAMSFEKYLKRIVCKVILFCKEVFELADSCLIPRFTKQKFWIFKLHFRLFWLILPTSGVDIRSLPVLK